MTTISPQNQVVTLVNVFTLEPGDQQRLMEPIRDIATNEGYLYEVVHGEGRPAG